MPYYDVRLYFIWFLRENKMHVASSPRQSYDLCLLTTSHLEKNKMMKISKIETSINNSKDNTQIFYKQPCMRWNWNVFELWNFLQFKLWKFDLIRYLDPMLYQISNNPFPSFTSQFSSYRSYHSYHLWLSIFPPKDTHNLPFE